MRVLVTGARGQLGQDVVKELLSRGHEVTGTGTGPDCELACRYRMLDITDREAVRCVLTEEGPESVIHCAAWTAVDAAEDEENRPQVRAINAGGTRAIAEACRELGCKMLYISTDYVFSGEGTEPWKPDCTDFAPLNYYGLTKLEGEQAVRELVEKYYIVRTSWVFGPGGSNFVKTMLRLAETREEVRVVNDQIGTPTYTPDLARLLADMCERERYGVYHASNEGGYISWAEFAEEIFRQAGKPTRVIPVSTEEYGLSKAKRPKNSRLDKSKLAENGFEPLEDWRQSIAHFIK